MVAIRPLGPRSYVRTSLIGPGPGLNADFDGSSTHLPMSRSVSALGGDCARSDGLPRRTTATSDKMTARGGRMASPPKRVPAHDDRTCAVCHVRSGTSPTRPIACESEPIMEIAPSDDYKLSKKGKLTLLTANKPAVLDDQLTVRWS